MFICRPALPDQRIFTQPVKSCLATRLWLWSEVILRTLAACGKNLSQFLRRDHLKLRIAAVLRRLVFSPAPKLCGVTKTLPLHVVVRNLHNQLRPQRFPRQILTLAPAALAAWHSATSPTLPSFAFGPRLPGMTGERVLAVGREEIDQLSSFCCGEAGANADVLQSARVIVQTEQ